MNELLAFGARNTVPSAPLNSERLILISDSNRDVYPDNNAVSFVNNLQNIFVGGEAAELEVQSMFTNWRPSSWIMEGTNNPVNFNIVAIAGYILRAEYVPDPSEVTVMIALDGTRMAAMNFSTDFYQNSSLGDQLSAFEYVGSAINNAWVTDGLAILNAAGCTNIGSPFTQADITQYPLGSVIGVPNDNFGILANIVVGNQPYTTPPFLVYPLTYVISDFAYVFVMLDMIASPPFEQQKVYNIEQTFIITNPESVRIARLLGLANDLIIPYAVVQLLTTGIMTNAEMQATLENFQSQAIIDEASVLSITTMMNNVVWGPIGTTGNTTPWAPLYSDPGDWSVTNTELVENNGYFPYYFIVTMELMTFFEYANSSYNNLSLVPGIKMTQSPSLTAPFSGVLLPTDLLVPDSQRGIPNNYYGNTILCRFLPNTLYGNVFGGTNSQGPQLLMREFIADWTLDNDRLYVMIDDDAALSDSNIGGNSIPSGAVILTLTANPFGVYEQSIFDSAQITYPAYLSGPTLSWPSLPAFDYAISPFMPLTYNPTYLNASLPLAYKPFTEKQLTSLRLTILNEVGQIPPVFSYNNKCPFTCFSIQLTRYGYAQTSAQANYFQTGIPFTSSKPAVFSRAQYG